MATSRQESRGPERPWRPVFSSAFREVDRIRRELNRIWENFYSVPPRREESSAFRDRFPEFDLCETNDEYILKAEVPGIKPGEIEISVVNNCLRIKGEKKQRVEDAGEVYHFTGRTYGPFCRSIPMPTQVDVDKVQASYKDGILKVVLPKSEQAKGKHIDVKFESETV